MQTEAWKLKFYVEVSHDERVRFLEERNITVFASAFLLHCLLSHLLVFSKKTGSVEPEVKMFTTLNFDGKKSLKELSLWLLSFGQDCDEGNYTLHHTPSPGSAQAFDHDEGNDGHLRVPGIGNSQLDPRNQEVLMFAHTFLKEKFSNRKLAHAHELTHPGGSFGKKPRYFLLQPLFLGGWPKPRSNAWDEDIDSQRTDGIQERLVVGV